ncbi:hypothetical protein KC887_01060 [Candidatus Kaiserbacteria bacterium]|jgi:hypothetical protein|nr:hypothetical protein [Candidatus Kaiserbacteria bacterium]
MYVKTLRVVFAKPLYATLFLVISFFVLSVAIMLPHVGLIRTLWQYESVSVVEILLLTANLYGSLGTNFTILSASYTVVIALLFGMQVTLLVYYLKSIRNKATNLTSVGASGVGGLISGFFGIGCAACGTFLLSSILVLFGAGGLLAWLPFGGEEFGLIGIGLLVYANYLIIKKIDAPKVCTS